jgi:hypothetical protein
MSGRFSKNKGYRTLDWLPDYAISESGDVVRIRDGVTRKAGFVPKQFRNSDGYLKVKVTTPEGKRMLSVHRLVCEAFHGKALAGFYQVAHNDGNCTNNHFTNLRWTTCIQNQWDRKRHGTDPSGERNGRAVLNRETVETIRAGFTNKYGEIAALAREHGMSHSAMLNIVRGRRWHGTEA